MAMLCVLGFVSDTFPLTAAQSSIFGGSYMPGGYGRRQGLEAGQQSPHSRGLPVSTGMIRLMDQRYCMHERMFDVEKKDSALKELFKMSYGKMILCSIKGTIVVLFGKDEDFPKECCALDVLSMIDKCVDSKGDGKDDKGDKKDDAGKGDKKDKSDKGDKGDKKDKKDKKKEKGDKKKDEGKKA